MHAGWLVSLGAGYRGVPLAGAGVGEAVEAEAFKGGAAGGEGVHAEAAGAGGEGVAGAGGDDGAVEALSAVGGEGGAAVEAGEEAVGMGVKAADAHGVVGGVVGDI